MIKSFRYGVRRGSAAPNDNVNVYKPSNLIARLDFLKKRKTIDSIKPILTAPNVKTTNQLSILDLLRSKIHTCIF